MISNAQDKTALGALKLGPDGFNKICLLGTAPSTMALAPFKDPSWSIWACSPGAFPICAENRSDVWFEPHRWLPTEAGKPGAPGTRPWFSADFHTFLGKHKGPVFMSEVQPTIPSSVRIPFEDLIAKYGPYFWTSTIAYMLAIAIDTLQDRARRGEEVFIGMFGIDMSATEEYDYQRPGIQHFVGLAKSLNINVLLPRESDLMRPPTMYGIGELNPRHITLLARRAYIEAQKAQAVAQHQAAISAIQVHTGQLQEIDYMLKIWSDDIAPDPMQAVSYASEFRNETGALSKAINGATTGADVVSLTEASKV